VWPDARAPRGDLHRRVPLAGEQVLEQTLDLPFTRDARRQAQPLHGGADRADRGEAQPLRRHARLAHRDDRRDLPRGGRRGAGRARDAGLAGGGRSGRGEALPRDRDGAPLLRRGAPDAAHQASVYQLSTPSAGAPVAQTSLPDMSIAAAPGAPAVAESLYQTSSSAGFKSRATVSWGAAPTPSCSRAAGTSSSARPRRAAAGRSIRRSRARGAASHGELHGRRRRARHLRLARGGVQLDRREERLLADHHQGDHRPQRAALERRELRGAELRRPGEVHLGQALDRRPTSRW
jgi:hypothetical protein